MSLLKRLLTMILALTALTSASTLPMPLSDSTLTPRQLSATKSCESALPTATNTPNTPDIPTYSTETLYNLSKSFLDAFIYPADAAQAASINSTLLAEDVHGRVDVTRDFIGRELNTEYLFGLFAGIRNPPTPDFFTLLGTPLRYELIHWAATGNVVSLANVVFLEVPALGNATFPFEIDLW
ncbi:MAG: hypothetical protein Q9162_004812 [Coniocarpon cinnabarinum]